MNAKDISDKLNGIKYPVDIDPSITKEAKNNNIVIAYGMSDDLLELEGAIRDEFSAYEGTNIYLDKDGVIENKCDDECCPYFKEKMENSAFNIKSIWCPSGTDKSWEILSNIPHEKFDIIEDGEVYCTGIVFNTDDLTINPV